MTMPKQKPGRSKQDYGTPWELIRAVEKRWGRIGLDLAAVEANAKAPRYITPEDDSLTVAWHKAAGRSLCWLNPPFSDIGTWVEKCAEESERGCRIVMLVPASIGSEWFARHVFGKAGVYGIRPRVTFEGCSDPYPKDCMLLTWGMGDEGTLKIWRWDEEEVAA